MQFDRHKEKILGLVRKRQLVFVKEFGWARIALGAIACQQGLATVEKV